MCSKKEYLCSMFFVQVNRGKGPGKHITHIEQVNEEFSELPKNLSKDHHLDSNFYNIRHVLGDSKNFAHDHFDIVF